METNTIHQKISPIDALWTIYQQQSEEVKKSFLVRVSNEDRLLDIPNLKTREEMMNIVRKRMKNIINKHEQTLQHQDVMNLVDNIITENA